MVLEFVIHSLESRNDERRSDDVSQIRSRIEYLMSLLAAEHFRLLALRCGTACHRRLRRHRLWRASALDSRRFCLRNHIL